VHWLVGGAVRVEENDIRSGLGHSLSSGVAGVADFVHEKRLVDFDPAWRVTIAVGFALVVVADASVFEPQHMLGTKGAAKEVGILVVREALGERPPLDAPFVVAFYIMNLRGRGGGEDLVEQGIADGDVIFVAVLGLCHIAKRVVLGQESAAVDKISADDESVWIDGFEVCEESSHRGRVMLVAVDIGKNHFNDVSRSGLGDARSNLARRLREAGTLKSLYGLGVCAALGLKLRSRLRSLVLRGGDLAGVNDVLQSVGLRTSSSASSSSQGTKMSLVLSASASTAYWFPNFKSMW
jgi:hypothetical protein